MPVLQNLATKGYEYRREVLLDTRTVPSYTNTLTGVTLGYDTKVGQKNPGWRDRIAKGTDASSGYSRKIWIPGQPCYVSASLSSLSRYLPAYRIDSSGRYQLYGAPSPQYTTDTETYNRALAKIKKRLASRIGSKNTLAPIAELRELKGLVAQATLLSTKFVYGVLQAKRTHGRSVYRQLTEAWLGFSFGLAPTISDIGEVGNAIAAYLGRNDVRSRLTASATKYGQFTYTPSTTITSTPFGCLGWKSSGRASYDLSYRFSGGFSADVLSGEDYSVLQHLGIGLGQIPALAWELTAFSWLFDYFANVGQYLEDVFTSSPGTTDYLVVNRRYTMKWEHNFEIILPTTKNNPNGMTVLSSSSSAATGTYVDFDRTVLGSLPHASLYFKSADTIGRDAITKLLNLISLVKV